MSMFGIHSHYGVFGCMSALTESLGGLLIVLGLWFRPAAFFLCGNMLVACATMWHGGPFGTQDGFGAWLQGFAMPFVFGMTFLALLLLGPGRFAVGKSP
jgi:putative oxidoreductase